MNTMMASRTHHFLACKVSRNGHTILSVNRTKSFSSNSVRESSNMARRRRRTTDPTKKISEIFEIFVKDGTASEKEQSLTSMASDYFANFRIRAAAALTESLTAEKRDRLLEYMNSIDNKSGETVDASKSIGEAVAAAVAEETKRNEKNWETEKKKVMALAEEAAMERVMSDLKLQEQQMQNKKEMENEGSIQIASDDPVLGPVLVDLGFKRVHVTTAKKLSAIPVWEKQRIYRHERAKTMANDKLKKPEIGLPGIIALHEAEDGQLSILDGQHRVGMMALLQEKSKSPKEIGFDLDNVIVEVFPQNSASQTYSEDLFTEINKAEPVKLVDMPGVLKGNLRKVITDAATSLRSSHPDMFKTSQRCRSPHVNIDNLRDALFTSDILTRHSIKTSKQLIIWITAANDELREKYKGECPEGINKTALKKAITYDFYLGLDSSWLYQ